MNKSILIALGIIVPLALFPLSIPMPLYIIGCGVLGWCVGDLTANVYHD